MKSNLPKVLHPLAGLSLLGHVIKTAKSLSPETICVVMSPELLNEPKIQKDNRFLKAIQETPLGTGHAALQGLKALKLTSFDEPVLILNGDVPLLKASTLLSMRQEFLKTPKAILVGAFETLTPYGYGRCVLEGSQKLLKIVEENDATPKEKSLTLCNSGVIMAPFGLLKDCLEKLEPQNAQHELYLTDIIELSWQTGFSRTFLLDYEQLLGVNTQKDLSLANSLFQEKMREDALNKGAILQDPKTVYFSHDTVVESGVLIEPFVYFGEKVHIKAGAIVKGFSHVENSVLYEKSVIGPFARLRNGCEIKEKAEVGNFVEVKNTTFEEGAKAKHLSYLGDAHLEKKVNVGAGTITCNYDGVKKSKTLIREGTFVGSNSTLIAPLTIEKEAYIAAGSVITDNIPSETLAIARSRQVHKNNWVQKKKGEQK